MLKELSPSVVTNISSNIYIYIYETRRVTSEASGWIEGDMICAIWNFLEFFPHTQSIRLTKNIG